MSTKDELARLIERKKKLEAKQKSLAVKVKEAKRLRKEATQYERWTRGLAPIFAQAGVHFENKDEFLRYLQWALEKWVALQVRIKNAEQKSQEPPAKQITPPTAQQVRTTIPAQATNSTPQKA